MATTPKSEKIMTPGQFIDSSSDDDVKVVSNKSTQIN